MVVWTQTDISLVDQEKAQTSVMILSGDERKRTAPVLLPSISFPPPPPLSLSLPFHFLLSEQIADEEERG